MILSKRERHKYQCLLKRKRGLESRGGTLSDSDKVKLRKIREKIDKNTPQSFNRVLNPKGVAHRPRELY